MTVNPEQTHISQEKLADFLNGLVVDQSENAFIELHVNTCSFCRDAAAEIMCSQEFDELLKETTDHFRGHRIVESFEIDKELGRGACGVVYQAHQSNPYREIALKMLIGGAFADSQTSKRFAQEAKALAQLEHPHVVRFIEYGEQDSVPFIAMELVRGESLAQRISRELPEFKVAAKLVSQIADAVSAAHTQGIIHRDLKPQNVLLTSITTRGRQSCW
ncbi:MAG: serine/threonine protein kinase, partial [Planctomycetaceae bacterium]|nr:serine/threonine protein kinase [Planctomycetaceae bacterium]